MRARVRRSKTKIQSESMSMSKNKNKSNFRFKSTCVGLDLEISGNHGLLKTIVFLLKNWGFEKFSLNQI